MRKWCPYEIIQLIGNTTRLVLVAIQCSHLHHDQLQCGFPPQQKHLHLHTTHNGSSDLVNVSIISPQTLKINLKFYTSYNASYNANIMKSKQTDFKEF